MGLDLRTAAAILALAGCYFLAGKLGLSLAYVHTSVTAVWPPTGIALAALLLWGHRLWPGIFLGAFFVNITTQGSVATTLGIAAGNTLEALLAAWAINRFANGAKAFERARNIFRFVLLAPVLSTIVSATFGVISLTLTGLAPWDRFAGIWLTWWLGDAVGDLIVTPLIVIWVTQPYPQIKTHRVVEAFGLLLSLILVAYLIFFRGIASSAEYIVVLPLLWAAFRFGQRGAVTSAFMISVIALVGTVAGGGPFAYANPNESLLHLQAFMGTMAVASLVLAAVISEGKRAEQRLQVQDAVSRILAESPALKDAAPQIVRVLCERAGWDFGALWNIDRDDDELRCVEVWHMPSIRVSRFEAITKERSFRRGIGLPGRVWNNGKSAWIADITMDDNFPRAPAALEDGLHSAFGFPIKLADEVLGVIECFSREVREPDDHFLQMVSDLGAQLGQFIERKRAENEIAALSRQMVDDLKAMSRLQDLSTRLVQTHEMGLLMHDILDVAIEIADADMGNVQLFQRDSRALKIVAQRGFEAPFLEFFGMVNDGQSACGQAMQSGERVIVEDVAASPIFSGTPACDVMLAAGARAAQSTPLVSRSGRLVGMFSTHYRRPYRPSVRQLALLDLLARQAADFIERTQTEDRLLHSEERLRAVVDTAVDGIITLDGEGTIITANPAAERVFAYRADEMIGQNIRMLMPEGDRNEHFDISNYLSARERKDSGIGREVEGRRKHGEIFPLDLGVSESRVGERRIFTAIVRDITERRRADELIRQAKDQLVKINEELERRVRERTTDLEQANTHLLTTIEEQRKLEEQLRQAQKMEIIGTLAGGIAHDFNNILNIIRGYVSLIGQQALPPRQVAESLNIIDREVERGASVVRQLLTVARKTETHLAPTRANDIVLTLSELIKQTFPKTITVALDLDPRLPLVLADSNQMNQALLNICVNGRDAMPAGGKLTLRTELIDAGNQHKRPGNNAASHACIVITDTGIGMDENVQARIFEPFFTTKGVGEGTGLGLAIVYGIVKEHNGFIDVESHAGHGTTFRLGLPIFQVEEGSAGDERMRRESAAQQHREKRGTVLVVEDEEAMVHLLRKLLSQAGYRILVAMDGQEAIDLYHDRKDEIDIVLLDLGLPKVTGFDVIKILKKQNPAVRIIIATGYLGADLKSELFRAGVKDCIHKPYLIDDLVVRLGSLIESP